jgi:hypothetical protein
MLLNNSGISIAEVKMENVIQNTRQVHYKNLEKNVTEVLVQFKNEDPAWIPLTTLEAINECGLSSFVK